MFIKKKLTNFKVIQKNDRMGKEYYIIFDNNNQGGNNAYFCWLESIEIGKDNLLLKRDQWKTIEIEYEEKEKGNKVLNIWSDADEDNFLI